MDFGQSSSATPPCPNENRKWRVRTALLVPKYFHARPDGGFPDTLEFHSRINEQAKRYGDIAVAISKRTDGHYDALYGNDPQVEIVEIVAEVPGDDMTTGLETYGPIFGAVLDLMSFHMGVVLIGGATTITDVTLPAAVGDERTFRSFSSPPFDLNARAVDMNAVRGALLAELPESVDLGDSKTAAILRWFLKALGTDLLHDQFIFLWIGLEILCDASDVRVVEHYVGQCQHVITSCPACGEPTTRLVRGATLRAFLQSYGMDEEQAKELWRMRQLMHGAIPFDSHKLANLGALVQPLRAVVAAGLKPRLGKPEGDPPIVARSGASMHPAMAVEGTGPLSEEDLDPLTPDALHT
jgi:hypothetical protein